MQNTNDPLQQFTLGFNDLLVKPAVDFFNDLFNRRDIADLTPEQQARVKEIDDRLAELKAKLRPVRPCREIRGQGRFVGTIWIGSTQHDCTNHDFDMKVNAPYQNEIDVLEKERDELINKLAVINNFEDEIVNRAVELKGLVEQNPVTAELKTTITNKLAEASKLIEQILSKQIEVNQKTLTQLQNVMQEASFKLQTPIAQTQGALDGIADNISQSLFGFGNALAEGFAAFGQFFVDTMNNLFDITPDKLNEAQNMAQELALQQASKVKQ